MVSVVSGEGQLKILQGEIEILQTKSCDNLTDLFTKSLPIILFQKYVFGIGMRQLKDLQESGGDIPLI
jgi:hypothetical protein